MQKETKLRKTEDSENNSYASSLSELGLNSMSEPSLEGENETSFIIIDGFFVELFRIEFKLDVEFFRIDFTFELSVLEILCLR